MAELHHHVEQVLGRDGVEGAGGQFTLYGLKMFGEQLHAPLRAHAVLLAHRLQLYLPHVPELVLQILAPGDERALRDVQTRGDGRETHALRPQLHKLLLDRLFNHKPCYAYRYFVSTPRFMPP